MRVISKKALEEFWTAHADADAEKALRDWHSLARRADWAGFAEVKAQLPQVDLIVSERGRRLVFNVRSNRYHLVCLAHFDRRTLYVLWIGTHAEYDRLDVKAL